MLNKFLVAIGNLWVSIPRAVRSMLFSAIASFSALAAGDARVASGEAISPYAAVAFGMAVTFLTWLSAQAAQEAAALNEIAKYREEN